MDFSYSINGSEVVTRVEGEVLYGEPRVLLHDDDNLTAGLPWADRGYTVVPFLPAAERAQLREGILRKVVGVLEAAGLQPPADLTLETYHHFADREPRAHAALVEGIRAGFPLTSLPIDYRLIERRVSEVVGVDVTAFNRAYGLDVFNLRVVRPRSSDNNPLHRDVWLDRLRNAVNIYVPLAGSDERSSLCLVPGSHLWPESEIARTAAGALVNGFRYTVPAVVGAKHPLALVRPNPADDEFMLFSPYLVHGGAANLNPDRTRASLEMRFWRR